MLGPLTTLQFEDATGIVECVMCLLTDAGYIRRRQRTEAATLPWVHG